MKHPTLLHDVSHCGASWQQSQPRVIIRWPEMWAVRYDLAVIAWDSIEVV